MRVTITNIFVALFIILGVLFLIKKCELECSNFENFGQDATTRSQVGWLAGPKGMYGYDPIDHFAEQIEQMREMEDETPGMYMMSSFPNLVDDPNKEIGPLDDFQEKQRYSNSSLPPKPKTCGSLQESKPCTACM